MPRTPVRAAPEDQRMEKLPTEHADIVLVRRLAALDIPDRILRSRAGREHYTRIRRGAYVATSHGMPPDRDQRYLEKIVAVVGTRHSAVVLSHHSAALMHGLPVADRWPSQVHITEPPDTRRRSKNGVIVHRRAVGDAVVEIDGMFVTSLARTVVDIAADGAFVDAVCTADAALRNGCTREELLEALESRPGPGRARALRVIMFADPKAETSIESWSRAVVEELGFPRPVLQFELTTARGARRLDMVWPDEDAAAEIDGLWKYDEIAKAEGMTTREVVRREKQREAEVRGHFRAFARWGVDELREPGQLRRILLSLGLRPLPSYRPEHPPRDPRS